MAPGVIFGRLGGGCPWLGGSSGLFAVGLCWCYVLHGGISCPRGPTSPRCGHIFLVLNAFGIGFVSFLSQNKNKNKLYVYMRANIAEGTCSHGLRWRDNYSHWLLSSPSFLRTNDQLRFCRELAVFQPNSTITFSLEFKGPRTFCSSSIFTQSPSELGLLHAKFDPKGGPVLMMEGKGLYGSLEVWKLIQY